MTGSATTAVIMQAGNGQGRNYVDADNNGVCDNYGTGGNGQGHHTGQGNGHHGGSRR